MADDYDPEALEEAEADMGDDFKYEPSRQSIVALIDASPEMLRLAPEPMEEDEDDEGGGGAGGARSYLAVAVDAVVRLMKWRIMHAPNDDIGVMFYGAANSNVDNAYASVFRLVPLDVPDVAVIHRLQEFTDERFKEEVGSRDSSGASSSNASAADDLRNGLWAADTELMERTKTAKAVTRSVFIFTCNEDPTGGNANARPMLDTRLDNLSQHRVRLELFPLLSLERRFHLTNFWHHALQMAAGRGDEGDADEGIDSQDGGAAAPRGPQSSYSHASIKSFMRDVLTRSQPARAMARLDMVFPRPAGGAGGAGDEQQLKIAVQMFSLLRPSGRPAKMKVTKDAFQEVKGSTAYMQSDGNIIPAPSKRAIHIKTKTAVDRVPPAVFDDSELAKVRAPCPAGLFLLGFKPTSALAPHHTLAPARFLFPDERRLKGSTAAFIALHTAMLAKDKVAIARLVIRGGNSPALVALVPQAEEVTDDGSQLTPAGLHVLQLPWRDEMRFPERGKARGALKAAEVPEATEEQVAAAAELVSSVCLGPDFPVQLAENINNPSLARHYEMLERLALKYSRDELEGDEVDDATLPDEESLAAHAPTFEAFSAAVYGADGAGAAGKTAGAKRKAGPEPHTAELYAERDWVGLANSDQLQRLTNDQLKVYLRYHGLTLGGNKADLLARIRAHANQDPA